MMRQMKNKYADRGFDSRILCGSYKKNDEYNFLLMLGCTECGLITWMYVDKEVLDESFPEAKFECDICHGIKEKWR